MIRGSKLIEVPPDFQRTGVAIVFDSGTGEYLGCLGTQVWADILRLLGYEGKPTDPEAAL